MTSVSAVFGFIFLVADLVLDHWRRKLVNDCICTPFERIPVLMFAPSYLRMVRLFRESYPTSWLTPAHILTRIGIALCAYEVLKSWK
jgi:hypothetical protein